MAFSYEELFNQYGLASLGGGSELILSVKLLKEKVDKLFFEPLTNGVNIDNLKDKNVDAINLMTSKMKETKNNPKYKSNFITEKLDFNIKFLENYKQMLTGNSKDALYLKNVKKYEKGEMSFNEVLSSVNDKTYIKDLIYKRQLERSTYKEIPPGDAELEKEDSHFVFVKYDDKNKTKQRISVREALDHNKKVYKNILRETGDMKELNSKLSNDTWVKYLNSKNPESSCSIINVGKEALKQNDKHSVALSAMANFSLVFNIVMQCNNEEMEGFKREERRLMASNVKFTELDIEAIELNNEGMTIMQEAIKDSESVFKELLKKFKKQQEQESEVEKERVNSID